MKNQRIVEIYVDNVWIRLSGGMSCLKTGDIFRLLETVLDNDGNDTFEALQTPFERDDVWCIAAAGTSLK